MKQFLIYRWPQISSKVGIIIGIVPTVVDLPWWGSLVLVSLGVAFFGADEEKLVSRYRRT